MVNIVNQFVTFTPTWSMGTVGVDGSYVNAGVVPDIGNGTLTGRYRRDAGNFAFAMTLIYGSTTNAAPTSTKWYFTLPALFVPNSSLFFSVAAMAYQSSSATWWTGAARIQSEPGSTPPATMRVVPHFGSGAGAASGVVPFTWATGDRLLIGNAVEAFDN